MNRIPLNKINEILNFLNYFIPFVKKTDMTVRVPFLLWKDGRGVSNLEKDPIRFGFYDLDFDRV
jgi:hypothetical protein